MQARRVQDLTPPNSSSTGKHVDPYYESHPERDAYVTLLQQEPPVPEVTLKAALVRRAIADVHRAVRFREDRPALQNLLQKGSVGDDLWNSLLAAEKELEGEVKEVCAEANTFVEGWGSLIFPTANEIIANEKMRTMFESTSKLRAEKGEPAFSLMQFPNLFRFGRTELIYGKKGKDLSRVPIPNFQVGPPPQTPATPSAASLNLPQVSPATTPAQPVTPSTPLLSANGKLHPTGDTEPTPTTPSTPSKVSLPLVSFSPSEILVLAVGKEGEEEKIVT